MNGTGDSQGGPDLYSWLAFVAVNWPVDPTTCTANANASILTSAPDPVWLSYLSNDEIFVASGPSHWLVPRTDGAGARSRARMKHGRRNAPADSRSCHRKFAPWQNSIPRYDCSYITIPRRTTC